MFRSLRSAREPRQLLPPEGGIRFRDGSPDCSMHRRYRTGWSLGRVTADWRGRCARAAQSEGRGVQSVLRKHPPAGRSAISFWRQQASRVSSLPKLGVGIKRAKRARVCRAPGQHRPSLESDTNTGDDADHEPCHRRTIRLSIARPAIGSRVGRNRSNSCREHSAEAIESPVSRVDSARTDWRWSPEAVVGVAAGINAGSCGGLSRSDRRA